MKLIPSLCIATLAMLFVVTTVSAQQPEQDKVFIKAYRAAVAASFCKDLLSNPQIISGKGDELNDELKNTKSFCDANLAKSIAILDAYQAAEKV